MNGSVNGGKTRSLLTDFGLLSGSDFVGKVIAFAAFAHLTRTVSPESYGSVESAAALATVFGMLIDCGLGSIGAREISKDPSLVSRLAGQIPASRLLIALAAFPLMGVAGLVLSPSRTTQTLVWIFAASLLLLPWKQQWLMQGTERMSAIAAAQMLRVIAFASCVLLFVRGDADLNQVGFAELAGNAALALTFVVAQWPLVGAPRLASPLRSARELLPEALPIGLAQVVWAFQVHAPVLLVAYLVGEQETAWFGVGHRIVVPMLSVAWLYHMNLFPSLVRASAGDPRDFQRLIVSSTRVVSWVGVATALLLSRLSELILPSLFGPAYVAGADAFGALVWVLPMAVIAGHSRWALVAVNQQKYTLIAQSTGAASVLVVGAVLIPKFGGIGAAAAMSFASLAVWAVSHAAARKHIEAFPGIGAAVRPWIVAAGVEGFARVYPEAFWLNAALAVLLAIGLAPVFDRRLIPDFIDLIGARERAR